MRTTGAQLGDLVSQLARTLRRQAHGRPVAPHQLRALRVIARGPQRPARLAEALGVTPRAVTDVVDTLSAAQLVVSRPDPDDRRAKVLEITALGRQRLAEARARRDEAAESLFSPLAEDERAELVRLLEKVTGGTTGLGDAP